MELGKSRRIQDFRQGETLLEPGPCIAYQFPEGAIEVVHPLFFVQHEQIVEAVIQQLDQT